MSLFLLLIIVAIVLGLIGAVVGLSWLLAIGVIVFVADLTYGYYRLRHKPRVVR